MALRPVSISDDADRFLMLYEPLLLGKGYGSGFVALVAQELLEVIFDRLPRATLRSPPIYLGVDRDFPGYSRYSFSEGPIHGTYTSNGEHVILLRVQAHVPALPVAQSRTSAA